MDKRTRRWGEIKALMVEQQLDSAGLLFKSSAESIYGTVTLVEAGLEEAEGPRFGCHDGVCEVVAWFGDGEDSRYEVN